MSDPLRTEATRPPGGLGDGDKEARIEQLLLTGLDQYFAGEYEQAINIWTRVVFLERGHSRARAYIERARGALAERHRESEELLHKGMDAFSSGQTDAARDLITRAVEQGGPHDVALVLLERLNRLTAPTPADAQPASRVQRRGAIPDTRPAKRSARRLAIIAGCGVFIAIAAGVVSEGIPVERWIAAPAGSPQAQTATAPAEPLPIAGPSDRLLARARAFQAGGHLVDAIRTLDSIDVADPLRAEADRLRGEIQRQLLDAGAAEASQ